MNKAARSFKWIYLIIVLLFLYLPILIMMVQSFNTGGSIVKWEGLTLQAYADLFAGKNTKIVDALQVTLSVAAIATVVSTVLGTLGAIGIYSMKKRSQGYMMTLTNLPNTMPDIVTGVSLMMLFVFAAGGNSRGYVTMLLAHITFDTPYVILSVLPRLKQMNKHTYEAALDLGATPRYALWHVIIPECRQGIVTGAMLAFTLSIDDFTISHFTAGAKVENLSMLIYSAARRHVGNEFYAVSTLMFIALLALLLVINKHTISADS
ncbi:MAG: ABC transporter permease [Clostridia bacterium]|nr:ABC transporter permease [Clostridia bacterium]